MGTGVVNSVPHNLIDPPRFKRLSPIFRTLNKENKSYGLQLYYGSLAMVATNYIAGITLSLFGTDNTTVGFFTLALTITTPLQMLPAIIGTAYFKQFATQPRIPHKVFQNTILLASATCILFILLIKPLVSFLYSEPYSIVSTYASWMAVGFSIHGVGDMINRYLGSHGQGKSHPQQQLLLRSDKNIGLYPVRLSLGSTEPF